MYLLQEKPQMVRTAVYRQRGMHWSLEFLMVVALYFVASIGVAVIQFPPLFAMMVERGFMEALAEGDRERGMQLLMDLQSENEVQILSLFSFAAITLIVLGFCRLIQKRKPATLGFVKKQAAAQYLIGLLAGFIMFSVAVLFCVLTGSLKFYGLSREIRPLLLLLFALGYIVQGMAEEVLCRGYMMTSIARRNPLWLAVVLNSLLFAMLHLTNPGISLLAFVNLFLFGVFASVYFLHTENIWGVSAIHSVWNFVQGNFYGIQVSGMPKSVSVLESLSVEGKSIQNGGDFGLEGGLGVTLALVLGIAVVLLLAGRRERAAAGGQAASCDKDLHAVRSLCFALDGPFLPLNRKDGDFRRHPMMERVVLTLKELGYELVFAESADASPSACSLLVSNDIRKVADARGKGMRVYLVTECLMNPEHEDISAYPRGDLGGLLLFVEEQEQP